MRASIAGGFVTIAVLVFTPGCFEEPPPVTCSEWDVGGLEVGSAAVGMDWTFDYAVTHVGPAIEDPDRRLTVEHNEGVVPAMSEVNVGVIMESDPESPVTTWRASISELTDDPDALPAGNYTATLSLEGYTVCDGATSQQVDTLPFEVTEQCEGGDLEVVDLAVTPGPTVQDNMISWASIYHFIDTDEPETGAFSMRVQLLERDTGDLIASGDFPAASHASNVEVEHSIMAGDLTFEGTPEPGMGFRLQVELDPEEVVPQCKLSDANHIQNDVAFADF